MPPLLLYSEEESAALIALTAETEWPIEPRPIYHGPRAGLFALNPSILTLDWPEEIATVLALGAPAIAVDFSVAWPPEEEEE